MGVPAPAARTTITSATALGVLTVADITNFYSSCRAWVCKNDGSARARVKILQITPTTPFVSPLTPQTGTLLVRQYANNDENAPPSYGYTDMSAFNATSYIAQEPQVAQTNPAFSQQTVA